MGVVHVDDDLLHAPWAISDTTDRTSVTGVVCQMRPQLFCTPVSARFADCAERRTNSAAHFALRCAPAQCSFGFSKQHRTQSHRFTQSHLNPAFSILAPRLRASQLVCCTRNPQWILLCSTSVAQRDQSPARRLLPLAKYLFLRLKCPFRPLILR